MLLALWCTQALFNVTLLALGFHLYRRTVHSAAEKRLQACLAVLETRAADVERDLTSARATVVAQVETLRRITQGAQQILDKAREASLAPASLEERELRDLVQKNLPLRDVPTLKQLEEARAGIASELPLDLKTLLREQLA